MYRRDLSKAFIASVAGPILPTGSAQSQGSNRSSAHPATAAEQSLHITAADPAYSAIPYDVRRFGAKGDGRIDDREAIQTAISVA